MSHLGSRMSRSQIIWIGGPLAFGLQYLEG
jgi:hypothetical protein